MNYGVLCRYQPLNAAGCVVELIPGVKGYSKLSQPKEQGNGAK
jgi:hypothetical protein